jgi:hypothetical protein
VSTDALTEAEIAAVRKRLSDDDTELSADEKAELDAASRRSPATPPSRAGRSLR